MSCRPRSWPGSDFGPISTKSLYITGKRFTPWPSARNFSSGGLRVHEHHVGVAAPREVERLAGAERDHAHLDAGLLLESGQDVAEQPRLLGRGGRGDDDEVFLRDRGQARRSTPRATTVSCSSPWQLSFDECGGLRRLRCLERIAPTGARSTSRPWSRNRISSPRRRAWPRLCVAMTILVPAASNARITDSISRVALGSRLAVGSSRNSTSGCSAQARASASRCCSPPESTRAGRRARCASPTLSSASRTSAPALRFGDAGELQRVGDVGERRAAQHHRPLEHHRLLSRSAGTLRRSPADAARTSGSSRPCISRISTLFARAVRAQDDRARPASISSEIRSMIVRPPAAKRHVVAGSSGRMAPVAHP